MIIYKCNLFDIGDEKIAEWFNNMSEERQDEVAQIKNKHKKNLKIIADHLCRKAISDFCGVSPEEILFSKNSFGKPFAMNIPVHFNVSHSGDMVVCAVSDREIGIDIEKIKPFNIKAASKFATDEECGYIGSTENGFFEIWTLKEAYFKCVGTGLGSDIKNVSFNVTQNGIVCSESGFELCFYDVADGYICSVCQRVIL